jgi:prepilin-type N-terminal cleavage/methylation domain-containing protein
MESRAPDDGFTLMELMVVLAIMSVVAVIAGTALFSLQSATVRTGAMVTNEQDASTTLAQMGRDIRSAHAITFPSSTSNAADAVILYVNQPSGGTIPIEWVYQPPTAPAVVGALSRETLNAALTVVSGSTALTDVGNGPNPVFAYYNLFGAAIGTTPSSTQNPTLASCTTGIGVTLMINPSPVNGVSTYQASDEVAITDQEQALSAPGDAQCGAYGY